MEFFIPRSVPGNIQHKPNDSGFNCRFCGKYATQSQTQKDARPLEDQTKSTMAQVKSGPSGCCTRLCQIFVFTGEKCCPPYGIFAMSLWKWLHLLHTSLWICLSLVPVLGPYCSQLLLVPVQCTVSFITYAGPIWSDKPSPSSEAIKNNNDDKTQRIFSLFWKWLFCVAWGCFPPISRVTWQPFPSLLPSDPYQARASGSSFGMGAAPFHHPCWPSMGRGEATVHAMDSRPLLW